MLTVYGIRQCDTCRKALKLLVAEGIEHRFHDLREQGLEQAMLEQWLATEFAGQLVNRRSTAWRGLSASEKETQGPGLVKLLLAHPTLIKRPVFANGSVLAVGFDPQRLIGIVGAKPDG